MQHLCWVSLYFRCQRTNILSQRKAYLCQRFDSHTTYISHMAYLDYMVKAFWTHVNLSQSAASNLESTQLYTVITVPAWQSPGAQSEEIPDNVVCPDWCERTRVVYTQPWPQPHALAILNIFISWFTGLRNPYLRVVSDYFGQCQLDTVIKINIIYNKERVPLLDVSKWHWWPHAITKNRI